MRSLCFFFVVGSVLAAPQYNVQSPLPAPSIPAPSSPCSYGSGGSGCGGSEPEVNVYVFDAPYVDRPAPIPADIPQPRVRQNIVFIKTAENDQHLEPIIIPQSQEKTLVYVLSKNQQQNQQQIQFEDAPAIKPEVFYVHYDEGENIDLPGGYDLQSALASANAEQGQLLEGAGGAGGFGGGFGGAGGSFESAGSSGGIGGGFAGGSGGGFGGGFDGGSSGGIGGGIGGGFDGGSSGGIGGGFGGGSAGGGSSGGIGGGFGGGSSGGIGGGFDGGSSGGIGGGFGGGQNSPSQIYSHP